MLIPSMGSICTATFRDMEHSRQPRLPDIGRAAGERQSPSNWPPRRRSPTSLALGHEVQQFLWALGPVSRQRAEAKDAGQAAPVIRIIVEGDVADGSSGTPDAKAGDLIPAGELVPPEHLHPEALG